MSVASTNDSISAAIESGVLRFQAIDYERVQVRVTRDAVLVTSHGSVKGQNRGKDISGSYEFSRVYEKRNGTWELAIQRDSRSHVSVAGPEAARGALDDPQPRESHRK